MKDGQRSVHFQRASEDRSHKSSSVTAISDTGSGRLANDTHNSQLRESRFDCIIALRSFQCQLPRNTNLASTSYISYYFVCLQNSVEGFRI